MIDVEAVEAAARRLDGVAVCTPLLSSAGLDTAAGGRVLLKAECLQRTGSFKIRGAYNLLSQLSREQAGRGAVAWSSGNHAQGVACAAGLLGIHAAIVMPADAPAVKRENTARLGGEIVAYDRRTGDREAIARRLAAQRGAAIVPSYDHEDIIAGQGTAGLELAAQLRALQSPPDQVLICCGGGGLTAGCVVALRASFPECRVFAVEPEAFDDTARSLASGNRECIDPAAKSICDALQTPSPGELTLAINRAHGVSVLLVSDDDVRTAMRCAFDEFGVVVEPGGAVALAAILSGKVETKDLTTAAVLSGGNVDPALFDEILSGATSA